MKTLFYNICEAITEHITGLVDGEMTLWELVDYTRVFTQVSMVLNFIIITVLFVIIYAFIRTGIDTYNESKKQIAQTERD